MSTNNTDPLKNLKSFMQEPDVQQWREEDELEIMMEVLIHRIKEIRKAKKLSQAKLAELMGVQQPEIARWESGEVIPSTKALIKFCSATGTRLELIY